MPDNLPAWNPDTMPYPAETPNPAYGSAWGGSSSSNYANPYDPRIGNGGLPPGIQGSAERAYVGYTQGDQTAEQHVNNMLNRNSAYMQNADRQGRRTAQGRGLLNSSIAAGNAQAAAINAAAPIAMQDANTYAQQARQNVDVLNQRAMARESRSGGGGSGAQAAARLAGEMQLQAQRERLAYEGEQAELQRQYGSYNQNMGYGQALGLQNNQYSNMLNNDMSMGGFQAAVNSNYSNQQYYQQAALQGMNNPAIINNPTGFQNYLNFIQGPSFQNNINSYLNLAFGGG